VATYTVYERGNSGSDIATRADAIRFVREGFAWLALFFPLLWMMFHCMWVVLLAYVIVITALQGLLALGGLTEVIAGWLALGISVLFAFQANDLRRWTLARKGYVFAGIVTGRNRAECETRFFDGWLANQEQPVSPGSQQPAAGPHEANPSTSTRPSGAADDDVIGLFPEPNT